MKRANSKGSVWSIGATLNLMLSRALSEKVSLILRGLGLSLAVAISAGVFIYLDALGQSALSQLLDEYSDSDLDVAVRGKLSAPSRDNQVELTSLVRNTRSGALEKIVDSPVSAGKSITLVFDEEAVAWSNARTFIAHINMLQKASEIISGSWPGISDDMVFDAAISEEDASYLGFTAGDLVELAVPGGAGVTIQVRITGIYRPLVYESAVWEALGDGLGTNSAAFRFAPMIVSEEAFLELLPRLLPDSELRYYWIFETAAEALQARDASRVLEALEIQERSLRNNVDGFQRITSLDDALARFKRESTISRSLMLAVGATIALASLSFVALVAGQARELRANESGMARARGATVFQEALLMAGESVLIVAVSLFAGVALALLGVSLAGSIPPFSEVTDGAALPATLSMQSSIAAIGTAVTGLGFLLVPSIIRNMATARDFTSRLARPARHSVLQRYYLDVILLGLGIVALWQLSQEDLFISNSLLGEGFSNRLALAMPAAVSAGGAIALLRFLPLCLSLLAEGMIRLPSKLRISPAVPLAIWSLARNPRSSMGLMLLIIMSVSIAVLLAVFTPSLDKHSIDAEHFRVGADLRISQLGVRSRSSLDRTVKQISELNATARVTPIARIPGTISSPNGNEALAILGVDPEDFASSSWWRNDLSKQSLDEMMDSISDTASGGIPIPKEAAWLTALLKPDAVRPESGLVARLRDAEGHYYSLTIGNLQPKSVTMSSPFKCPEPEPDDSGEGFLPPDWCRVGIGIEQLREEIGRDTDLTLDFIGISRRPIEEAPRPTFGSLRIREIAAFTKEGEAIPITTFDEIGERRTAHPGFNDFGARIDPASESSDDGAVLTWEQPARGILKGVMLQWDPSIMKVIADKWFKDELEMDLGSHISVNMGNRSVNAEIVAFAEFFPTFVSGSAPFLIADIKRVWEATSIDRSLSNEMVNELWVSGNAIDSETMSEIREALEWNSISSGLMQNADTHAALSKRDTFATLGWSGYLFFGFVALTAVSALAFAVNGWTMYRLRQLELAVLKSMGLSSRQLLIIIGMEQSIIAVSALLIGAGFGFVLSSALLPYLAGEDASSLAPPMSLRVEWQVLFALIGSIAILLLGAIGSIFAWMRTQRTHLALRAGTAGK